MVFLLLERLCFTCALTWWYAEYLTIFCIAKYIMNVTVCGSDSFLDLFIILDE